MAAGGRLRLFASPPGWLAGLLAATGIALLLLAAVPAAAEDYYSGKTIRIVVPFDPGGGTDIWARFWAPLLAANIPGRPEVEVENIPGGGSTAGANLFAEEAGGDGMTILASSASVLYAYLLQDPRVRYDYRDWRALLASPANAVVYAKAGMVDPEDSRSLDEASTLPWRMHIQGPTQIDMIAMLSLEMLGFEYDVDFGADGAAHTLRSFSSDLYNVNMQTSASYLRNVLPAAKRGEYVPLFTLGVVDQAGNIVRDGAFPEVPTLIDLHFRIHGRAPAGRIYEAWQKFFLAGFPAQKMLIVPRATDPEPQAILEKAIEDTLRDEGSWPSDKEPVLGGYRQVAGDEADELLRRAIDLDPAALAWYREFVLGEFNIEI